MNRRIVERGGIACDKSPSHEDMQTGVESMRYFSGPIESNWFDIRHYIYIYIVCRLNSQI